MPIGIFQIVCSVLANRKGKKRVKMLSCSHTERIDTYKNNFSFFKIL